MSSWGRFSFCGLAAALILVNGCLPLDSSRLDDEKEPHFVLGKSRVNAMDYDGAIEAFSESLEANPRSAAAHFQLAWLFDTKKPDNAAAIYHYQEFLRLDPRADNAEVIRQRIYSCKQQLAVDVMPLPSAPAAQKQLEDLAEKNRQLQAQVDQLNEVIKQWNAYYTSSKNIQAGQDGSSPMLPAGKPEPDDVSPLHTTNTLAHASTVAQARPRTHVVAAGETLTRIARSSGVSLAALQAANPRVTPTKLSVGQVLNLPRQ